MHTSGSGGRLNLHVCSAGGHIIHSTILRAVFLCYPKEVRVYPMNTIFALCKPYVNYVAYIDRAAHCVQAYKIMFCRWCNKDNEHMAITISYKNNS